MLKYKKIVAIKFTENVLFMLLANCVGHTLFQEPYCKTNTKDHSNTSSANAFKAFSLGDSEILM